VLYAIVKTSDVFLTNKQPRVLEKLKLGIEDIRAQNADIIYARGSAFGPKGPDRDHGGYDMTGFWCRAACAAAITPPGFPSALPQPGPAYGDSIGGMTIAGGIAAALLRRERTGEAGVVDVSLLGTGAWAMSSAVALSLQNDIPWGLAAMASQAGKGPGNPLTGTYKTQDDRFVCFVMLQAFKYWPDFCEHIGRPELVGDPRFDSHEHLSENSGAARAIITEVVATRTLSEWTAALQTLKGQWAPVQNTLELAADPQMRANGYMVGVQTKEGVDFELVASPVQFDEEPTPTTRGPEFNEHGDEILASLGYAPDEIIDLKVKGAIT
jgi:crotonobetainyl-CoA:carnitine CoA-transferase CaiB-like acyl-CoA transferase